MKTTFALVAGLVLAGPAAAQYADWKHTGSAWILTTPEGADLPAGVEVNEFPLLVRLHRDFFDFSRAKPDGADLRFASAQGDPLPYQIEEWDAKAGHASVWVRVPKIIGNARQVLKLYWGKADATSESNGKAVFDESNGYLSVWHMCDTVGDEAGTLTSKDTGTTAASGMIGAARHFPGGKGIFGGDRIPNYPSGSRPHTTEAWFRAEQPNGTVLAWGNEQARGKVVMHYQSPPHVQMDCYFSGGNVAGKSTLTKGEWVHVAHTYEKGDSRLYVNGVLDGVTKTASAPLDIRTPARLWIGGWYDNYTFVGDIDEVRVSKVVRSAEWVKLQYENQKPLQTLVGPVVSAGNEFAVSRENVTVSEGRSARLTARAGGAQKLYWLETRDGRESVVAVDRLAYDFAAGRVVGDQRATVRFRAVYPDGVKSKEVAVTIRESIPEPVFTLRAPPAWDGRTAVQFIPEFSNLDGMRSNGAGQLNMVWGISGIAVIKDVRADRLVLTRAQNSGPMTVTVAVDNGGKPTVRSATVRVTEPATDAWVERTPAKDEKPVDGQFYARDDKNEGTLHCNGTLAGAADAVILKVFADGKPFGSATQQPRAGGVYSVAAKLKPGLVKYRVELIARTGDVETVIHKAADLVCGDAFLINGQSNAVATDFGKDDPAFRSDWVRTFGTMSGNVKGFAGWGNAVHRGRDGEKLQIGYWGMELGRRLVEAHQVPVCVINGAVGGSRIDQHQRNAADPTDEKTIYGRLLWRVRRARLTHGIRGVIWHQGENDQGADGPTGGYGHETYRQSFIDLAAAWKQDYPNVRHYYVFQIWPKACSMGVNGSDNRLREAQRTLPTAFSNLSVLSTLGIDPPGGCHFPAAGYAEFARSLCPLIERDFYGKAPTASITPPDLKRAAFTGENQDELVLEFDQPVKWDNALGGQFSLDGARGQVASGSVVGTTLRLKLTAPSTAKTVTYLDSAAWSQKALLKGENGLAALTFCEVPISPANPAARR
ncbi:MotA/TolQ/ExbB proton channel family protein [Fimbriiglobus ruber]|uniref:MotA/TolQ/ExbB proton channel family protein n=2 Tax=Fimbriiglobus ruber TaxID=1908690 RepID=A0A225DB89_9BACT|nr:MotA/TolQ/ExbB proton channel family protein [Fimbriiglobus ruber]